MHQGHIIQKYVFDEKQTNHNELTNKNCWKYWRVLRIWNTAKPIFGIGH